MKVFRIVKNKSITDLSGTGAFRSGGRWNNKGIYMLYTSENSSLAFLEVLVHFNKSDFPPHLYIMQLSIDETATLYTVPDNEYPKDWLQLELPENKKLGDEWMESKKFLGIRVRSAINTAENNILLNPMFPHFYDLVKLTNTTKILLDERLIS